MLKAHSRLFEHLALATDLGLIAGCWLGTYALRFHVFGGGGDIPPFRDYALQLVPILLVWGFAYKMLDLYRPLRLGSHLSEWFDVAKASTLGVLVLIAIMTFMFRGYPYSRLVIAGFWAASIVMVSLSRAATATTSATPWWWAAVSRPPRCCGCCGVARTPGSGPWACSATSATARAPACRGWAVWRRSATC